MTTLDESFTVDKLRPVRYLNKLLNKDDFGFIAHELQTEYQCLVQGEKDGENNQSINYSGLIAILVNEIQMLKQEMKSLKSVISTLSNK